MNQIIVTQEFNWKNWLIALSRWFSMIGIFLFVSWTGIQNGTFDNLIIRLIVASGFSGYTLATMVRLVNRGSPEFWIYRREIKEDIQ